MVVFLMLGEELFPHDSFCQGFWGLLGGKGNEYNFFLFVIWNV